MCSMILLTNHRAKSKSTPQKCRRRKRNAVSHHYPSLSIKGPNLSCELKMLREQTHTSPTTPPPLTPSSTSPSLLRPNHPVAVVAGRVQLHPPSFHRQILSLWTDPHYAKRGYKPSTVATILLPPTGHLPVWADYRHAQGETS